MNKLYIKSMSNFNRKYPKVEGWWCYCLITPDGMFYIGCSGRKECCDRWNPSGYKNKTIYSYIEKYGWDNIRKVVLCDCLTEYQAKQLEDLLIQEARKGGWCINKNRSGLIEKENRKGYMKNFNCLYKIDHCKEIRLYNKQRNSSIEGKIYNRVCNFNRDHPNLKTETPLEAKQKYLEWGYIPSYIKSDDLL